MTQRQTDGWESALSGEQAAPPLSLASHLTPPGEVLLCHKVHRASLVPLETPSDESVPSNIWNWNLKTPLAGNC